MIISIIFLVTTYFVSQFSNNKIINQFYGAEIIFEFIFGFFSFFIYKLKMLKNIPNSFYVLFCFVTYGTMIYAEIYAKQNTLFYIPISAFILVICFIALENKFKSNNLAIRFFTSLGDASYATYLTHWFVVVAMRKIIDGQLNLFNFHSLHGMTLTVITALFVGQITYLIADKPLHKYFKNILLKIFKPTPQPHV